MQKSRVAPETVHTRHDMVRSVDRSCFDVVVIGAGINGAGIARDAAMRGLKVLLVDKGDIASGASSASTRLIHGGLRYLEHFEFGLVRESLVERENLLRIAPHLVRPLAITIPIYKQNKRGPALVRAGMMAYDLLSWRKSLPGHRMLSRTETLTRLPGLNPAGLLGSALYFDAQVEFAERLVMENVLAAQDHGTEVLTYTPVTGLRLTEAMGHAVEVLSDNGGTRLVQASVIINAAGPWIDQLLRRTPLASPKLIGGTKGSHIVVPPFEGAPAGAIYVEARADKRPFFIIPWNHQYLIGTTDVPFEDDPDQTSSDAWEIDYLLAETNAVFPDAKLKRDQVLFTYSGVRPLPATSETEARSITRRHFIREHPQVGNLLSIVGGKLTTYRSLAEECVDLIFRKLGKRSPPCRTQRDVLPGAAEYHSFAKTFRESDWSTSQDRERLLRVYGSRAAAVAQVDQDPITAEVVFAFQEEDATSLADCFLRRTMFGLDGDSGFDRLESAADVCRRYLGWSEARAKREIEAYRTLTAEKFGVKFHSH